MKLIDCFMYFDEDLVLDIRLNTLDKEVDKFIIAEATRNHAGQPKKLNFKIEGSKVFKIDDIEKPIKRFLDEIPFFDNGQVYKVMVKEDENDQLYPYNNPN